MDIQNNFTPPKKTQFQTPPHSSRNNRNEFTTPPNNKHLFQTPKRQILNTPSSSQKQSLQDSYKFKSNSLKPKQNPESKKRVMSHMKNMKHSEMEQQKEYEEYQVSMFKISRLQQDYSLQHTLGNGHFSQVSLYRSRLSKELFAIKETKANCMSINEVQALGSLWVLVESCSNVIRYYHSWIEDDILYLVMEYCEDSLQKLINRHRSARKPIDEQTIKKYLKQSLLALQSLHKHGIIHLDLKPENMLLKRSQLKIADFGLSRAAKMKSKEIEEGDSRYLAKELLNLTKDVDLSKSDIFSLALTIYEMMTLQQLPNNGELWINMRQEGLKLSNRKGLSGYSKDLLKLVECMASRDWQNRPSATQCLRQNFLRQSNRVTNLFAATPLSSKKRDNSL